LPLSTANQSLTWIFHQCDQLIADSVERGESRRLQTLRAQSNEMADSVPLFDGIKIRTPRGRRGFAESEFAEWGSSNQARLPVVAILIRHSLNENACHDD
jgi:hypothetical protein